MQRALVITLIFSLIPALLATPMSAAVIGYAYEVKRPSDYPFLAPEAALGAPWRAYQLTLQSNAGELIQAVDVSITGNKLHQRWIDTDFDGITDPSPIGQASSGRGDSHLTSPAGSPFGLAATETNSLSGSPLPSVPGTTEYGLGNLRGAWAVPTASTTVNLAYIVINQDLYNEPTAFQISVKAATPTGAALVSQFGSTTWSAGDFWPVPLPPIPEPSTTLLMGLAAVGGTGFVRRRPA